MKDYYWSPTKHNYVARPKVIEQVTRRLEVIAFGGLLVGTLFVVVSIVLIFQANLTNRTGNFLILGASALAIGFFFSKLGKDFYNLKTWSYRAVMILYPFGFGAGQGQWIRREELTTEEVRQAFGVSLNSKS